MSSALTFFGVSKSLGGWLYLSRKLEKFIAWLVLALGITVVTFTSSLMPTEQYSGKGIFYLVIATVGATASPLPAVARCARIF